MAEHVSADHDRTAETLRCIYCQRTIKYPQAQIWPSACLHCGRWPGAYTAATRPKASAERPGGEDL